MLLQLCDIKIKKRIRKNPGELQPLMESLRTHGLMNPVVVNSRLEAARRLGWEHIEATVLEKTGELPMLELEIEENVQRRDFSNEELAEGLKRLEKLRNPGFLRRIWQWIRQVYARLLGLE